MQNDVNLSTKDDELGIKYGPYKFGTIDSKPRELAFASVGYLMNDMINIRENYMRLGFHLFECRRNQYYMDFGYPSLAEFCAANFGLDSSAVSRCINVFLLFSASEKGVHKMWIDDKYKNYSYSQLCEMVSMDDVQRSQVTPDMTIKQIREIKKNQPSFSDSLDALYKLTSVSQNVSQVATSQPEKFDSTNYSVKKGIVQQNYVKNCKSLENVQLRIFDKNGKFLKYGHIVDVIYKCPGSIYLRLRDDYSDISDLFY